VCVCVCVCVCSVPVSLGCLPVQMQILVARVTRLRMAHLLTPQGGCMLCLIAHLALAAPAPHVGTAEHHTPDSCRHGWGWVERTHHPLGQQAGRGAGPAVATKEVELRSTSCRPPFPLGLLSPPPSTPSRDSTATAPARCSCHLGPKRAAPTLAAWHLDGLALAGVQCASPLSRAGPCKHMRLSQAARAPQVTLTSGRPFFDARVPNQGREGSGKQVASTWCATRRGINASRLLGCWLAPHLRVIQHKHRAITWGRPQPAPIHTWHVGEWSQEHGIHLQGKQCSPRGDRGGALPHPHCSQ